MTSSPNIALTYLEAAQSQKHVTVNDAFRALDAIVQLQVKDRDLATPPGSPANGDRYLVAASPTGAWSGKAGKIAAYQDGAWTFYSAKEGWLCYVADEDVLIVYSGSAWMSTTAQSVALMGINTTADSTNKLAVASSVVLLNNVGNGVQVKLNKAAAGDTGSLLFQTNWSGRAEIGLCGDNNLSFKGSADGSTWYTGLTLVGAAKSVPKVPNFTTANLPSASTAGAGAMAYNTTLGAMTISDGSNWDTVAASSSTQGKHTLWIPASEMIPRTTNGAAAGTVETSTNKVMLKTLDFDQTTQEFAQFSVAFPKMWNEGTVTAQFFWYAPSFMFSSGVVWGIQGVALSSADAADAAFGTQQVSSNLTTFTAGSVYATAETSPVTIAGTPAEGDVVVFQVKRVPADANDTYSYDACLLGVKLLYSTNAETDD